MNLFYLLRKKRNGKKKKRDQEKDSELVNNIEFNRYKVQFLL